MDLEPAVNVSTTATEILLPGKVEPSGLDVRLRELPAPAEGEVVLRMDATGVSFAEQQMRRGKYFDQPPFPFVPGYDVVGTVTAVGSESDTLLIGRRFAAVTKVGSWASHLLIDTADLVAVPDEVDAAAAETVLVNGITAWQMLHRTAKVPSGATIVVLGANGGVGSTLVQLARYAGITVIGTASDRHHEAVRELGAIPVDYRDPDMYQRIREIAPDGVDAVFDHVGGSGLYLPALPRPAGLVLTAVRQSCTGPTGRPRSVADQGGNETCQRRNAIYRTCPAFAYSHPQRYRVMFGGFGHPVVALDKDDTQRGPPVAGAGKILILTDALVACAAAGHCAAMTRPQTWARCGWAARTRPTLRRRGPLTLARLRHPVARPR